MVYLYSTITVKLFYPPGTINIIPFNTFSYYSIIAAFPIISIVAAFAYIFNIAALHYCVLYPTGNAKKEKKISPSNVVTKRCFFNLNSFLCYFFPKIE